MKITDFGTTKKGEKVYKYTLCGKKTEVDILNYGGTITAIRTHDKNGKIVDVCLGYDTIGEYESNGGYLGALIGRVGNRIAGGKFTLNGKDYQLALNDGKNHLHGGKIGFDKKMWNVKIDGEKLFLETFSPDMEENYPGNLMVKVIYTLENDELSIEYFAKSDKDTLCNLTNHCYFNLEGGGNDIYNQELMIDADYITTVDTGLIPHGKLLKVSGTPFDFSKSKKIGRDINEKDEQLKNCGGYDHNFCLNTNGQFKTFAVAYSEKTGIEMECKTTLPGVQLYTGNFIDKLKGKGGVIYKDRGAFCLETQVYPNAINCPNFPSCILRAGEEYHTKTSYRFSVK